MPNPAGDSVGVLCLERELLLLAIGERLYCCIDDVDARCVRYALVGSYRNDLSSRDRVVDPIALTERDMPLASVAEVFCPDGRLVSLSTRECLLPAAS